jgi:hypothetical protein
LTVYIYKVGFIGHEAEEALVDRARKTVVRNDASATFGGDP